MAIGRAAAEPAKRHCKECGGSALCCHSKLKCYCKECGGSALCCHGRQKRHCRECCGPLFCQHRIYRSLCKECGRWLLCCHGKKKSSCRWCREAVRVASGAAANGDGPGPGKRRRLLSPTTAAAAAAAIPGPANRADATLAEETAADASFNQSLGGSSLPGPPPPPRARTSKSGRAPRPLRPGREAPDPAHFFSFCVGYARRGTGAGARCSASGARRAYAAAHPTHRGWTGWLGGREGARRFAWGEVLCRADAEAASAGAEGPLGAALRGPGGRCRRVARVGIRSLVAAFMAGCATRSLAGPTPPPRADADGLVGDGGGGPEAAPPSRPEADAGAGPPPTRLGYDAMRAAAMGRAREARAAPMTERAFKRAVSPGKMRRAWQALVEAGARGAPAALDG